MKVKPDKRKRKKSVAATPAAKRPPLQKEREPRGILCKTCGRKFKSYSQAQEDRRSCETCIESPQPIVVERLTANSMRPKR